MASVGAVAGSNVATLLKRKARSEREKKLVADLLRLADTNGDGAVDLAECAAHFRRRGLDWLSDQQVRAIFQAGDKNGDCRITPDEVIAERSRLSTDQTAKLAVAAYDGDGDGRVSRREMEAMFRARGIKPEAVAAAFASNDANGDGFIDEKEMAAMLERKRKQERNKARQSRQNKQ